MRAPMSTASSRTTGTSANSGGRQAGSQDASVQSHIPTDLDPQAGSVVADEVQQRRRRDTFVQTDMSEGTEVRQLIQRVDSDPFR